MFFAALSMTAVGLESLIGKNLTDSAPTSIHDTGHLAVVKSPDKFWVSENFKDVLPIEVPLIEIRLQPLTFPVLVLFDGMTSTSTVAKSPHLASRPPPA